MKIFGQRPRTYPKDTEKAVLLEGTLFWIGYQMNLIPSSERHRCSTEFDNTRCANYCTSYQMDAKSQSLARLKKGV
jgi:hypothetical protein